MQEAHLNAIVLARDRTRNHGHRRPELYQLANQVDFSIEERAYIIEVHYHTGMKDDDGNWNYNITECEQQFFFSQFPDYIITEYFRRNVINLVDKFRATECTERKKSVIWPTKVTEDARERMQRGPNKSVKKLAVEIGVSYGSAHKILRNKLGNKRTQDHNDQFRRSGSVMLTRGESGSIGHRQHSSHHKMYSVRGMTDMHYIYGLADGNTVAARQLYAESCFGVYCTPSSEPTRSRRHLDIAACCRAFGMIYLSVQCRTCRNYYIVVGSWYEYVVYVSVPIYYVVCIFDVFIVEYVCLFYVV
ncbi:hypothetical protein ANN_27378 [Periplaneta americana]|uniref:Uncharacterized protein n=1 Tax=Periplaneta americana TaxID=6978 RepID=A0ABQ8RVP5_PERAM|nr:hypothetical protein ANN_27378 [Periplaneta americana]